MDHRYLIYGLQLRSSEPLGGLLPGQPGNEPDLDVIWRRDEYAQLPESAHWLPLSMPLQPSSVTPVTLWRTDITGHQFLRLRYSIDGVDCDFVFDQAARKLSVFFPGEITRGRLRSYLLGSVLSSILRLRGVICLHASVVSVGGEAIAFAARKGEGKSTTAAALAQLGAAVLSDDIAAITMDQGRFMVHPGEMDIRLLQASVAAVYGNNESSANQAGIDGKVRLRLNDDAGRFGRLARQALPLAAIYLFERAHTSDAQPSISQVPAGDRYMALFQHFYGFWLDKDLTHGPAFKTLSQLANTIPIYRIQRRRELDQLPLVCDAIMKTLAQSAGRKPAPIS